MGRKIMAVIVGMITAVAIIWVGWMIDTMFAFNTPNNLEYRSAQDKDAYALGLPITAYLVALFAYAVAAFAGGFISTKMGRRWSEGMSLALVVGGLLTLGSLMTIFIWPQPFWMILSGLVVFIPLSLVGYKLASNAV